MRESKVLILGFTWPEPTSTAAGTRMMQLIHFFKERSCSITFACASKKQENAFNLEEIEVQTANIELNNSSFDQFLIELRPDITVFDRFLTEEQFGWRVAEFAPNSLRVLDTEDLHSLRKTREEAVIKNHSFELTDWMTNVLTKREIASIFRCDISLIISSFECRLLKEEIKIDKSLLLHLPFTIDTVNTEGQSRDTDFRSRANFISIGNGRHQPNIDALKFLRTEIWPIIRKKMPSAIVNVYGAYLPQQIVEMNNPKEGFHIKGWAADANEVMSLSRVNLAPLRFGAGIKGKLLLGMQMGTPSVTTPIGAEGMHDGLPWGGFIEENPKMYAEKAVELYNDEFIWNQARQTGYIILNAIYNREHHYKRLESAMTDIMQNLERHRIKNFVGSLLQHESFQATKFMAKWIEAKTQSNKYI